MKQPCQKWQGCLCYGSRKDAREMHREEGMPDNIRRNRNRGRDAGQRTTGRNGGEKDNGEEGMREMPDNIRRNRNRGRDAGDAG